VSPLTIVTPKERRAVPSTECGGRSVTALFQDSLGRVWIGGTKTVSLYANGQFSPQSPAHGIHLDQVSCFAEDPRHGDIWAGGASSLTRFSGGQWQEVRDATDKSLNGILCLRADPDGSLWVGVAGVGLLRLKQGQWSSITEAHGLPTGSITRIIEDDRGYWWLGSSRGVIRAHRTDIMQVADGASAQLPCQVFTLGDGLASVECTRGMQTTGLKDSKGRLWFATVRGLATVDPALFKENTIPPPVRLDTVRYKDRHGEPFQCTAAELSPARNGSGPSAPHVMTIPSGSSQLEARFSALSYTAPEKVKLRYQLDRNSKPFLSSEGSNRTMALPWLEPGHYRLHVTAMNDDGFWNDQGATLAFVVQPFYWQTLWFRILTVLVSGSSLAAVVTGLHRNRLSRMQERLQQQQALSEERARSATLTQYASDAIILLNPQGRIVYESPSTTRVFGYAPGFLLDKDPIEFTHPEDQATAHQAFESIARHRTEGILTAVRIQHSEGHWVHVETLGTNLLDLPGVNGIMMTVRDITQRKQAQDRLQHAFTEIRDLKDQLEAENVYLRNEIHMAHLHGDIVAQSDAMKAVMAQAERVAPTDSTVLIQGETGTGKELLARAIHNMSTRKDRALVTVNCAAIPSTLIESELFGREKGAYTGAVTRQIGHFEIADKSTIFLDEIGELPAEVQAKLLRVLQEGQIQRLGSTKTRSVDVRVIAVTNRDLAKEVEAGRFRQDLFYRLNIFPITVPALRDRREDITPLIWIFVAEFAEKMGKKIEDISHKSMEALEQHTWPGNIRELRNTIERTVILTSASTLRLPVLEETPVSGAGSRALVDIERQHITKILKQTSWRVRGKGGAAEILGLKPTTLETKMAKIGIHRPTLERLK